MNDLFSFDTEITEQEQKQFVQITNELKTLITQAKSSGVSAWEAGEKFFKIKYERIYKKQYTSFEDYIKKEFGITDQTANSYIKIFQIFKPKEEISNLLSSSLTAIADIENFETRKKVVEAFANRERKSFRVKDVITTIAFIGSRINISKEEINKIIDDVLKESGGGISPPSSGSKKKRNGGGRYGESFKKEECRIAAYEWIEKEPINEMGVVALFCIIFHQIKSISFEHSKGTLTFESINYIQVAFPDINIKCKLHKRKKSSNEFIDIRAEFEYRSRNYLEHEHHKSKTEKCDLIICWEDNIRNNNKNTKSEIIENMPPILELKEFLKTGEITLRF